MLFSSTDARSGGARAAPLFPFGMAADTPAEQFAGWLPYSAYLAPEKIFVNRDSMGVMLELMPQSGADERMAEVLVSLYANCPPGIEFESLFSSGLTSTPRSASFFETISLTAGEASSSTRSRSASLIWPFSICSRSTPGSWRSPRSIWSMPIGWS